MLKTLATATSTPIITLTTTVTHDTVTATTASIWTTETTSTVTTTATQSIPSTFSLQVSGGSNDGSYFRTNGDADYARLTSVASSATTFTLDNACHLVPSTGDAIGTFGNTNAASIFTIYFNSPAEISASNFVYLTCHISPDASFSCDAGNGENMFYAGRLDGENVPLIGQASQNYEHVTVYVRG